MEPSLLEFEPTYNAPSAGCNIIHLSKNSLIIHEPVILLDDRNQSRTYIFITGIDQGQNSVSRSNEHNEKPVNRNGNRHSVSGTGTAYRGQAQRIGNRHSVSRTGTAYANRHSVSRRPTERISSFVGTLLQPISKSQKSYLKDRTDFINFIEKQR